MFFEKEVRKMARVSQNSLKGDLPKVLVESAILKNIRKVVQERRSCPNSDYENCDYEASR